MEAFGYEPASWPEEWRFENPPTKGQQRFFEAFAEGRDIPREKARLLFATILEAFGLRAQYTEGHCDVLIDFLTKARRAVADAEREAWKNDGRY